MAVTASPSALFVSSSALLDHWQGHRRLTRRMIDAFPDDKLFSFSVGSMRPFGELAMEMLAMASPMVQGMVTNQWTQFATREAKSKQEVLRLWDESTEQINKLWPQIPAERFQETLTAFGQYTDKAYNLMLYVIDNEVHHRGQGYVYLRALGIAPPPFYERA